MLQIELCSFFLILIQRFQCIVCFICLFSQNVYCLVFSSTPNIVVALYFSTLFPVFFSSIFFCHLFLNKKVSERRRGNRLYVNVFYDKLLNGCCSIFGFGLVFTLSLSLWLLYGILIPFTALPPPHFYSQFNHKIIYLFICYYKLHNTTMNNNEQQQELLTHKRKSDKKHLKATLTESIV